MFALICLFAATSVAQASIDELAILPASAQLDGPRSSQRFLVEARSQGSYVGERTASAAFAIDDGKVAAVDSQGKVTPVGPGETTLSAIADGKIARAKIVVKPWKSEEPPGFRNEVLPILTKLGCNSGACHGAAAGKNGFRLSLRGYAPEVDFDVLTRQALGRRVNKSAPAESLLLLKATAAIEHGGGVRMTTDSPEYRIVADWIAGGCPSPRETDSRIEALTVLPPSVVLKPNSKQTLIVQATYSDGKIRDVTRWAKFSGTDDSVAKVSEDGVVAVAGRGEAAVAVWFSNLVARVSVASPYDGNFPESLFAEAPRTNFIDDLNLAKLRSLRIPPSPPADDLTFIRRAYLDATGVLPSVEASSAYVADKDPSKRAKLVDRLLNTSEYVDNWSYQWSDLFLLSSKKLAKPALWSFYRFVRRAVADNLPWDRLARRIVTARGSTFDNGAANYYVLHRDPIDLTENVSMAFLGMSITCARCHNHPLEKWTQDQYYGMANLFARVKIKDGDLTGESIVSLDEEGDVLHPRRGTAMPPQPLDAKALPASYRGDRREALADWLASADNPYFARAIVNRVWRNFFGRGLVEPEDDLRATNPPSDEALMSRLSADFVEHGYDVKRLIRLIMNSSTYARSSEPITGNETDRKFLSHYLPKRLSAEVLLDALDRVTGVPENFAGYPRGWRSRQLPDSRVTDAFLDAFGRPERETTCSCERSSEPSVAQALHLANGSTLNDKLRSDSGAPAKAAALGLTDDLVLDRLFRTALSRPPSASERAAIMPILAAASRSPDQTARRRAIEDLYWSVLTGKEFLFNH